MRRTLVPLLGLLVLVPGLLRAGVPDPALSLCGLDATGRLLLIPDGLGNVPHADFSVIVKDETGAVCPGVPVDVVILGTCPGNGLTGICPGQALTLVTDPAGMVVFNIGGGGCCKTPAAVTILCLGVALRTYDVIMSPDYAASDNAGIPGRFNFQVSPVDLAAFVASYQGGAGPASCHDYDNNGVTGPSDLSAFIVAYKSGTNFCGP